MNRMIRDTAQAAAECITAPANSRSDQAMSRFRTTLDSVESRHPIRDALLCLPGANPQWKQTFQELATDRVEQSFAQANQLFSEDDPLSATRTLADAVSLNCVAIAIRRDWPHQDNMDEYLNIVGLATGDRPDSDDQVDALLENAPQQGWGLHSAYNASTGRPLMVPYTDFYDRANGADADSINFARWAVDLANELAEKNR